MDRWGLSILSALTTLLISNLNSTAFAKMNQNVASGGVENFDWDAMDEEWQQGQWESVDSGYYVKPQALERDYVPSKEIRFIYQEHEGLRQSRFSSLPISFADPIDRIHAFIANSAASQTETMNGISHFDLSQKIIKLAFCFNTDPYMTAAKIFVESRYNRSAVSPTNAVGLTQLTGAAIDEVNDQLGNRGDENALATNGAYIRQGIACYLGTNQFKTMWDEGAIPYGNTVSGNGKFLRAAKAWILSDIDRDLLYGQIVLKLKLAHYAQTKLSLLNLYRAAFRAYNAEAGERKDIYAKMVLSFYQKIISISVTDFLKFSGDLPLNAQWTNDLMPGHESP